MNKIIVHVSEVNITEESGMGRVAWHWQREFEKRGYDFIHIGLSQVGKLLHNGLFPYAAYDAYKHLKQQATLFLVHEPASGLFIQRDVPLVVFSHGVERRGWELALEGKAGSSKKISLKTRVLYPMWRLHHCDLGLQKASKLLLINQEDADYVQVYYRRKTEDIYIFKNGIYSCNSNNKFFINKINTVLWNGSWIERKGNSTLIEAAKILYHKNVPLNWLLAGTALDQSIVLKDWPPELWSSIKVISSFNQKEEERILSHSSIFVLPSFFEGQPLSLLQAMKAGCCCITTNCCGQKDLIQHGYNGLVHQPGDAVELAALIEQCVKDETARLNLGKNAQLSVKNRTWETVSAEVADWIEKTLLPLKGNSV